MKNLLFIFVCTLFFSCKGNGQDPAPINDAPNPETIAPIPDSNFVFSGNYKDLLTLELASRISGFEPAKGKRNPHPKRHDW